MAMIRRVTTIDAHAAGQPLRLIVDGIPRARGGTMLEKRDWLRKRWDRIRRALLTEPRGHVDMCGAVLTEAVTPGSHAGVLFMDTGGFAAMSGHGVIAVVTIALERGLLHLSDPRAEVVLDTPAGTITAKATWNDKRVERVSFLNVPSFVLHPGVRLKIGARTIQADIAFGGMFYVIADSETLGVAVQPGALAELRTLGSELRRAAELAVKPVHPKDPAVRGVYGAVITGLPDGDDADLRAVTVLASGQVDRSPGGTATAAVMAVVDAMGMLDDGHRFVHEGLLGTTFTGSLVARTTVGDQPAIVVRVEGEAWITGEHQFVMHEDDPFGSGLTLASRSGR